MQLETLKIFCDVVRLRSFSRGAKENGVTQSTASQSIHGLEEHLGVTLIERAHRPLRLTSEGRTFFAGCREVVQRYSDLENAVRQVQRTGNAVVRVAAIYSVGLGDMSQLIQRFTHLNPGTRVQMQYLHPDRVYESVLGATVDFGIVSFPRLSRELTVIPWRKEPMVLVCHPSHRLAGARRIAVPELAAEPFIAFTEGLGIRRQTDQFLKRHGVTAAIALAFDNVEAIKRAVEVASGVAILPEPTLRREVASQSLVAVPFATGEFVRPLAIVYRRGRKLYPTARQFIELLQDGLTPNGNGHGETLTNECTR